MNDFKPGDVVKLKSDSPKMTVDKINKEHPEYEVSCLWHENGEMKARNIASAALVICKD